MSAGKMSANEAGESEVIWHDLECGVYRADLPLWRELARACPDDPILDVGAGTGRVALALARDGRAVVALDRDPRLLRALRERAGELAVETVCADARRFALPAHGELGLCLAPMQTVQLLGGATGRRAFLRCVREHLRPGGLLACAIVTQLEPFDCTGGGPAPSPDTVRIGARLYVSQPTRVEVLADTFAIERERRCDDAHSGQRDVIELDRLSAAQLEREGAAAGLRPQPARTVGATAEHSGSTVVMLRA
ncbi:MAG TPA: class I SAM-dependent methyltransferase [Solirubrobacteraceae bacterium]